MTESDDLSVYPSTHEIVIRGLAPLSMRLDCDHTRIPVEVSTAAYLHTCTCIHVLQLAATLAVYNILLYL